MGRQIVASSSLALVASSSLALVTPASLDAACLRFMHYVNVFLSVLPATVLSLRPSLLLLFLSLLIICLVPQFWGALPTVFPLHGLVFATRNYGVFASDQSFSKVTCPFAN